MSELSAPKLSKWPFLLGDALLLALAVFIACQRGFASGVVEVTLLVLCVAGAALLGITPYLLEYGALVKVVEAGALTSVTAQIKDLESIAARISGATGRWQDAQDAADQTARAAREIADRMSSEVRGFTEFMQKANDSERATLRLEVEKLHRAEGEWLQVLVRVLDHVYALNAGARRSGQPNLIEQLSHFQNACRDAARRVGLTPFAAEAEEPYDAQRHQLLDGAPPPPADAVVAETIATGYTFQGRLIRPALVHLREPAAPAASAPAEAAGDSQAQFALAPEPPAGSPAAAAEPGPEAPGVA